MLALLTLSTCHAEHKRDQCYSLLHATFEEHYFATVTNFSTIKYTGLKKNMFPPTRTGLSKAPTVEAEKDDDTCSELLISRNDRPKKVEAFFWISF